MSFFCKFELICINDGSTDSSLFILNNFAKIDKRVRVISQRNKGAGASRNVGLDYASGDYIYFIDSDDCIVPEILEKLYNNAISNNSDIVLFKKGNIKSVDTKSYSNYSYLDKKVKHVNLNNFTLKIESN